MGNICCRNQREDLKPVDANNEGPNELKRFLCPQPHQKLQLSFEISELGNMNGSDVQIELDANDQTEKENLYKSEIKTINQKGCKFIEQKTVEYSVEMGQLCELKIFNVSANTQISIVSFSLQDL